MGGRGATSGFEYNAKKNKYRISTLQKAYDGLVQKNVQLYKENSGFAFTPDYNEDAHKQWLANAEKIKRIKDEIFNLEQVHRNDQQQKAKQSNRTFINSYGEATDRDITTDTFKKQQKQRSKDIMKFIGG